MGLTNEQKRSISLKVIDFRTCMLWACVLFFLFIKQYPSAIILFIITISSMLITLHYELKKVRGRT